MRVEKSLNMALENTHVLLFFFVLESSQEKNVKGKNRIYGYKEFFKDCHAFFGYTVCSASKLSSY